MFISINQYNVIFSRNSLAQLRHDNVNYHQQMLSSYISHQQAQSHFMQHVNNMPFSDLANSSLQNNQSCSTAQFPGEDRAREAWNSFVACNS